MTSPPPRRNASAGLIDRCLSALVAALFFGPLLALLWLMANVWLARTGSSILPPHLMKGAIIGSAVLGFVLPSATPTVFGWLAEGFFKLGRLFFFWW